VDHKARDLTGCHLDIRSLVLSVVWHKGAGLTRRQGQAGVADAL
jgi:hypothetical protein